MTNDETTPIERPLMRSDLDATRKAMHNLQQIVIATHEEVKAMRNEPRTLALVCVLCTVVSLGCAVAVGFQ